MCIVGRPRVKSRSVLFLNLHHHWNMWYKFNQEKKVIVMAKKSKKQVVAEEQKTVEPVVEETPIVEQTGEIESPVVEEAVATVQEEVVVEETPIVENKEESPKPVVEFDITEPKPSMEAIEEVEQEEARSKQKPAFLITLQVRDLHKFDYDINGKKIVPRGYVNSENLAIKEAVLNFVKYHSKLNEPFDLRIYSNGSIWFGSYDDIEHLKGLVGTIGNGLIVSKGSYACIKMRYQR